MDLREQLQTSLGDTYSLERELGGGGMSRVFIASENALGRRVVVKVLSPELAASVSIERFKREIALAARLQHPHIVPLLSAGHAGGIPYFTMPYVEGQSLRARLARDGELPITEGVRILREIASALDYAHESTVVHRDIKPDNVLLSRGSAMVTDFGVAKALSASSSGDEDGLTSVGMALGTPAYMAPEQAAASPNVDARADIYAWGIMAYEMFAGRAPFAGRTPQAMLAAHVTEAPEPITKLRPNLPPGLANLIMRCLEKHAADRPQTAAELVHTLDSIATPSGGSQPTSEPSWMRSPAPAAAPTTSRQLMFVWAGLAAIVVIGLIATFVRPRASGNAPPPSAAPSASAAKSIAVLPFVNASGDSKDEYFSDGIADELITALSIPGLRVMARSSSFAFKGKALTARQIGESLHVTSVLEAQVRRAGNRLRLTAQLVNVADGLAVWSQRYEREMKDVFAVQDEIAQSIASELKVVYNQGASRLASGGTTDLVAHDLYLKGLFDANQRTKASVLRGIEYFTQAIARDSTYALAYLGLADAHVLSNQHATIPARESGRLAERAALKALSLDSTLAEAHATLGLLHANEYRWREAEAEFKRAIGLRPEYARAYHWFGTTVLRPMGRFDSAQAVFLRGRELDPSSPALWVNYGITLSARGEYKKAVEDLKQMAQRFPDNSGAHLWLGVAYAMDGQYANAEWELKLADAGSEIANGLQLAWLYGKMGRRAEADSIIRAAEARAVREHIPPKDFALAYVGVGDKDRAFEYLTKAVDGLEGTDFAADPQLAPLRGDPRYVALLKKVHLEP